MINIEIPSLNTWDCNTDPFAKNNKVHLYGINVLLSFSNGKRSNEFMKNNPKNGKLGLSNLNDSSLSPDSRILNNKFYPMKLGHVETCGMK